jgi:tRNA-specific adenosine deaminase 3
MRCWSMLIQHNSINQLVLTECRLLKSVLPPQDPTALQHLRRFAREEYLPAHLKSTETAATSHSPDTATLHLLVCLKPTIALPALESAFNEAVPLFEALTPSIRTIVVPEYPPTSASQAAEWSEKYWPIVYKNTNPYGPHPALVARAQLELLADGAADANIALAWNVAREVKILAYGFGVGAVVVERVSGKDARVVAVAGDARHCGMQGNNAERKGSDTNTGNVMAHAVMRVIDMVAQSRLRLEQAADVRSSPESYSTKSSDAFVALPITPSENQCFDTGTISPNGYLCLDLEIYLTHEPCIMCAMAILHSRFGRVVFDQAMPKTGALSAERGSLEYGLFWRDQLNWKLLCWRWDREDVEGEGEGDEEMRLNADVHA